MTRPEVEQGSFRDRQGRVFYSEGRVFRGLSATAAEAWKRVAASAFFPHYVHEGKVVGTREAALPETLLRELAPHWVLALEHDRIPFISYPYEWSFSMLRDAALLQLDLTLAALAEDMILKDASAYNFQWRGSQPVFIDVASFEPWVPGDPWVGYLQFCQLFLYPLLLTAYREIPFQPLLRGSIDGISPEACRRMFSARDRLRPGVLKDVDLQAKLQAGFAASRARVRSDLQAIGFDKQLIVNNLKRLRKIVAGLSWRRESSEWVNYEDERSYGEGDRSLKESFVREAASERRWRLVWDLGSNLGEFSRVVADHAEYVVAFDVDPVVVDRMYRSLRDNGPGNILPLAMNLADASPALGWRGAERKALTQRALPDLTLSLALLHHLVITANIPLPELVDWLADLGSSLVVEFATKDDVQVQKLLRNKPDIYFDYERDVFERLLAERFRVERQVSYHGGTRTLYLAHPIDEAAVTLRSE